jgi:hypothetical protein
MAISKITITLQDAQLKEVRDLVAAPQAKSVLAFLQHAVSIALNDASGWQEMLTDLLRQTGGPLTEDERDWADAILSPERNKKDSRRPKAS